MVDDLAGKVNDIAAAQRRTNEVLGTDFASRQSIPGPGHLFVGTDAQTMDLLPPGDDGHVLTANSLVRGGMAWAPAPGGGGSETDHDDNGNTWEGAGALVGHASTAGANTAIGTQALSNLGGGSLIDTLGNPEGFGNVGVGYQALAIRQGTYVVGIGYRCGGDSSAYSVGNTHVGALSSYGVSHDFTTALGYATLCTAPGAVAIGTDHNGASASSSTQDLIVLGTGSHTTRIPGIPAFVSGDKYLVVDSIGDIHKSALGPAS